MPQEAFGNAVVVLKAMGCAPRLELLETLASTPNAERCVGEIERLLGLSQSAVSQHLTRLKAAGLVRTRRDKQMIYYSLSDKRVLEILRLLGNSEEQSAPLGGNGIAQTKGN